MIPTTVSGQGELEAIHFLRTLNAAVYRSIPDTQVIGRVAAWPKVTRPPYLGGWASA